MSATTISSPPRPKLSVDLTINLIMGWHLLLLVGGLAALVVVWGVLDAEWSIWYKAALTVPALATAVLSAAALPYLRQRKHHGRVLSLIVNYLGFILSLLALLQLGGVFVGVDQLANTFMQGLPFLFTAFLGYVFASLGDRYEDRNPARQKQFRVAGKWIAALSLVAWLIAIESYRGVWAIFMNWLAPVPLFFLVATILFGLAAWGMWRRPLAEAFNATNADIEMLEGFLFVSPNLLGFLLFFAGPLLFSLYVSFTNWDAFSEAQWVGLDNYIRILNLDIATLDNITQRANEVLDVTLYDELARFQLFGQAIIIGAQDKLFWTALYNTLKFVIIAVPLAVLPALFLANLLNSKLPGMKIFRAAYFLPSVAAVVGIALIWQWLYNSTVGYINYAISLIIDGLNFFLGGGLENPDIRWLSSSNTALIAVTIMYGWRMIGFNTVLFLAGLQNIPNVLYEAATVDGANVWNKFRHVTIPLLGPTTFFVLITTLVGAFQVFEDVYILIPGQNPAGPGNSTLTMVLYLYQKGFQRFEQGYASAIAWVLFLMIFVATLIQFQRQRAAGSEEN